ncbi:putative heat shock protein 90 [Neospora caninum Liverpool]|uniref:Putative heat shock protein 90 n=1 Tax=Neospora caninum (strain Liverpool) TaxID=572307 RepID=F0VMT0_NEOCL|nr:putative heat shock protein 90 [Neospora caninum Liverpool]CBZ55026.1 putative heat shock protein 90 [Neospora caninum Liverpool]|eukprot:XP_003885054.1 putative heat shock protein 90 [Neospora caninum Liverpool]
MEALQNLPASLVATFQRGSPFPAPPSAPLSSPLSVLQRQDLLASADFSAQANRICGSAQALHAFVSSPRRAAVVSRAVRRWASPQQSCLPSRLASQSASPALCAAPLTDGSPARDAPADAAGHAAEAREIFPFQAEVKRVLDIIVNSLYTDRDVFLRELISNAADASDKKRMLMEKEGRKFRGSIRVRADREKNTLTIEDDGIGMSKAELINNLGTIAQSGTYRFLQQLKEQQAADSGASNQAASLIGQFGVGFYSAFLVADAVEVYSTAWQGGSEGDQAGKAREVWKWRSTCGQTFTLEQVDAEAERARWVAERRVLQEHWKKQKAEKTDQATAAAGEGVASPTGEENAETADEEEDPRDWSGTRVVLHLKEDSDDYLEDYKLKELMRKYSEFIQLPIHIWSERIEYERVPEGSEELHAPASAPAPDGQIPGLTRLTPENVDDQLGPVGDAASARRQTEPGYPSSGGTKFKTVTHRYYEWEHLNTQPPIWRRDERQLTDKDYVDFYKSTFKAYDDPLGFVHMKVEGQVEFNALLFIPGALPWELARNMFDEESRGIRLYVKRVFINDKFADAVPRWLTFIRGVVDSDELPLNVGREILQKSRMLQVINKRISAKAVEMMKNMKREGGDKWRRFWENYGKYVKVGAVEDKDNQEDLASLVQFYSTASPKETTDLAGYVERMKARNDKIDRGEDPLPTNSSGRVILRRKQNAIYYLAAENRKAAEESPALELPRELGYEVIFGTEPLDEFFLASLSINQFKGIQVIDVNKADLKLGGEEGGAGRLGNPPGAKGSGAGDSRPGLVDTESIETKRVQMGSLCEWLQQILGSRVHNVHVTDRLFTSPAVLVQGDFGLSPTMQRYMKQQAAAQGVSEQELYGASLNQPILELNPYHPIIQRLDIMVKRDVTDPRAKEVALQLFDVAALQGGYNIENPGYFAKRVIEMMKREADAALSEQKEQTPVPPSVPEQAQQPQSQG